MNREDKERMERRRRMLARELGQEAPAQPAAPEPQPSAQRPKKERKTPRPAAERPRPAPQEPAPAQDPPPENPPAQTAVLRPISPLLRRRQRRRRIAIALVIAAVALVMAVGSGAFSTSLAMLGDLTDSVSLYINRAGGGWPASTGIHTLTQVEPLAGGFVEMDTEDVAVYSAYGTKIRTIQPGYARPALTAGNTRFAVYNRAGTELTVHSRTRQLYAKSFTNAIMLCVMAPNGSLAVVTESERYAAEVMVYNPTFTGDPFKWMLTSTDGTPIALAFASDSRRFAAGTLAAQDGQLHTAVRLMDTASDTAGAVYEADTGSVILKLQWLSTNRVLAVFDTYAAVINASDGSETARYDYGGATLQGVSSAGKNTAMLLSVRGGTTLVTLNETLDALAMVQASHADGVSCTSDAAYLLADTQVECYSYDGTRRWTQDLGAVPQAVIDAGETLVFTPGTADVLSAPGE